LIDLFQAFVHPGLYRRHIHRPFGNHFDMVGGSHGVTRDRVLLPAATTRQRQTADEQQRHHCCRIQFKHEGIFTERAGVPSSHGKKQGRAIACGALVGRFANRPLVGDAHPAVGPHAQTIPEPGCWRSVCSWFPSVSGSESGSGSIPIPIPTPTPIMISTVIGMRLSCIEKMSKPQWGGLRTAPTRCSRNSHAETAAIALSNKAHAGAMAWDSRTPGDRNLVASTLAIVRHTYFDCADRLGCFESDKMIAGKQGIADLCIFFL
jgi:hypothetical protein